MNTMTFNAYFNNLFGKELYHLNKINKKYRNEIQQKFPTIMPILLSYGSNIYKDILSDIDVCFILKNGLITQTLIDELTKFTIDFHIRNKLPLDEEISFNNKLVFSDIEVEEMLNSNPFLESDGTYQISSIIKEKDFLESREMKIRLLLNILTSDHIVLLGDKNIVERYEDIAWKVIIKSVMQAYKINIFNVDVIFELLHKNPLSGDMGDYYLGYKTTDNRKRTHIYKKLCLYADAFSMK